MAPYDLCKVILVGVEILCVVPGRKAPNGGEAAAIDPHWRIAGRIRIREKRRNQGIERLRCLSRLRDVDAIRRVGELEIVHGSCADSFAQPADVNAGWLAPRLLDLGSSWIQPPIAC